MLKRPAIENGAQYRIGRACTLLAFVFGSMVAASEVCAQEPVEMPGPDPLADPAQGQPQALAPQTPGSLVTGLPSPGRDDSATLVEDLFWEQKLAGELGPEEGPGPEALYDPDQGEPQALAPEAPGSLFPGLRLPGRDRIAELRRQAYDEYGLTFAASYQQLAQWTSATVPTAAHDTALGGWAAFSTTWTPFDRGGAYEGSLVVRLGWRDSIGNNAVPAAFGLRDLGAIWSNYEFTSWDGHTRVEDLFWEQKIAGDFLNIRIGNQIATSVYNFFRFKDARTSFTASPFAFNETIPYPTFGLGMSFRMRPVTDPGFYTVGTLNDMNGDPAAHGLDWGTFGLGQYFYGLEFGKDWRRPDGEFDHLHLDIFYASKRSTRMPTTTPNAAGGGFKLAGEKQIGRFVGYANYTYNTAEGGGISTTVSGQTAVAGLALLRPFDVRGEAAMGLMWSQSLPNIIPGVGRKNQYGLETYWNIGVTPNSSLTPGVQVILNPALNPTAHFVAVPSLKFRIFI